MTGSDNAPGGTDVDGTGGGGTGCVVDIHEDCPRDVHRDNDEVKVEEAGLNIPGE